MNIKKRIEILRRIRDNADEYFGDPFKTIAIANEKIKGLKKWMSNNKEKSGSKEIDLRN